MLRGCYCFVPREKSREELHKGGTFTFPQLNIILEIFYHNPLLLWARSVDVFIYRTLLVQWRQWVGKCTFYGHAVRPSHDQKSEFCCQNEPKHLNWSPWKGFQDLWTGSPCILDPWPPTSVFVLKIQLFPCRLSLADLLFEWRISLWFPRAPAELHSVLWSRAGSAYTWASSQPDGPPGGVAEDSWIFKSLVNIWEFFLILLHVAHWTGGTRWGAVVEDARWRSSVACSW